MSGTLPLFPEPEPEGKLLLAPRLRSLARRKLYLGTSSWKYPGWLGHIYSPHRYTSQKRFDADCLTEYAETFPIVCGDFAYYQFPAPQFWDKLFAQVPETFLFAFKAPEEITRPRFPSHTRYGARAGSSNPGFLDAELLKTQFLDLLLPFAQRVPLIIFEFGAMSASLCPGAVEFAELLNPFLDALPQEFDYAVEVRNPEFLELAYFQALASHGAAHVFTSWTRMPSLCDQIGRADTFTSHFTVTRALLTPRRSYEDAVQAFSPYSAVREPNQAVRDALRQLLIRGKQRAEPTYIFVNNRLEGFAPGTIAAVTENLEDELE